MSQDSFEPIVERLKQYIAEKGLTNTQFADRAGIPRPTLSQILHGRNKTINDVLLRKLDAAFPDFNLSWLLFGRGDMRNIANSEISEPENAANPLLHTNQYADNKPNNPETDNPCNHRELSQSTNIPPLPGINVPDSVPDNAPFAISSSSAVKNNTSQSCNTAALNNVQHDSTPIIGINSNGAGQRRVVSIMVFYNDNSFETFVPEKTK